MPITLPKAVLPVPAMPQPDRTRRLSLAHGMDMGFQINDQSLDPGRIDTRGPGAARKLG